MDDWSALDEIIEENQQLFYETKRLEAANQRLRAELRILRAAFDKRNETTTTAASAECAKQTAPPSESIRPVSPRRFPV